ncbi:uncharacterized protein LOC129317609 isoform X2 [Prosopis cineraria]|uniref:uncharacterized protein LOC129317609 isoform X2 n=1 Tax=Prosopis cineraria TaxID=364024 RepID=UPI00240F46DB|nr:uncharacterized protein LOC129317609 isoform X2 [Prosopis cineraria]
MASIMVSWSPSSPQLRLALKCGNRRKFPAILQSRVGKWDRRFRVLCVAQDGGANGNGLERAPREGSWVAKDSKVDSFSGWSNSGGEEQSANSHKASYGVVGAGVAGVLLLTGLTFAAFSVSKQNISRSKQKQMEPLTVQQEVALTSDDHNNKVMEHVNANNKVEQENGNTEDQIDISRDCIAPESGQIPSNIGTADDSDSGSQLLYDHEKSVNGIDATTNASTQEVLPHEPDFDNDLAVPVANPGPVNLSESEKAVHSSNQFGRQDLDSNHAIDSAVSTAELEESPLNVEPGNSYDADSIPLNMEQKDKLTSSSGSGSSTFPNSSSSIAELPNNSDIVNVAVNTHTNTIPDPEFFPQNDIENLNKMLQVTADENESSLQEQISDKDLDRDSYIKTNRIQSEPPNSGVFFCSPGIPAPSIVSAAVPVPPGKVLVPAAVDQFQGQALAALQALKVIEPYVQASELCTRREYARWLVSASSVLSRSTISKVYPAMYIENVTELAFDDITPEDPDFSSIQGLAEAGLIESRLSRLDTQLSADEGQSPFCFSPESPLSRQDLVSWKRALEKRQLPEADRKTLYQISGFIDTDKIHVDACPALVADISAGEQGIIALAFGYTRLFQPDKPVTKAQAAVALATGDACDIVSEELARIEAESIAENAVAAHSALVAEVEKDINASFEQELSFEREKINAVERMAEEAARELERLRAEREEENNALMKERTAIESEMEVYSRLRNEVEDQLQSLMNDKVAIAYEKERVIKLREQKEVENKEIARLQYELEVERKALSMARTWAEDEAKRVREHARALEEARERWERHGIKVVVDDDLRKEASADVTWLNAGKQFSVEETVDRAENLLDKLKKMAADVGGKSRGVIERIVHMISLFLSNLKQWASKTGKQAEELGEVAVAKAAKSVQELQQSAVEFGFSVKEGAKRVAGDWREGVEKLTQKFKT